ncbi:MAG TPA: 50S ribosomal protein L22, partial [Candidatus Parcubacteria bacterium]|nr:50S ribosomal protein L22 [Candidatus Parcubacteria bacterium]
KARLVVDLVRRKRVDEAERILELTVKRAAKPVAKLLKTAVADARNNFHIEPDNLYISKIFVDEGPKYKRWRPRSRGMANEIIKRTSRITLVLREIEDKNKAKDLKVESGKIKEIKKEDIALKRKRKKDEKSEKTADKEANKRPARLKPETETTKIKPKKTGAFKKIFRRKAV